MNKILEIGEIGVLRDIPFELTLLTNENKLLKQGVGKLKFEKQILICSIVALVLYIFWREFRNRDKHVDS